MLSVKGRIERVLADYPDLDHWTIFELSTATGEKYQVKANGFFPPGWSVEVTGEETNDSRSTGKQIKAFDVERSEPKNAESIGIYLASFGFITSEIGETLASQIEGNALATIEANPQILERIDGLDQDDIALMTEQLAAQKEIFYIESALKELGLKPQLRCRIFDNCGYSTRKILEENPYQLANIPRVPFKVVDEALIRQGVALDDPRRLAALFGLAMERLANGEGHTWATKEMLIEALEKMGSNEAKQNWEKYLETAVNQKILLNLGGGYALPGMAIAEESIARQLIALNGKITKPCKRPANWASLNKQQQETVVTCCQSKFSVLTGGPGCGKTFTVKAVLEAWNSEELVLCAPTGKAAKRMQESTGRPAMTIHYLMQKLKNEGRKPLGNVVVDEASMLNVEVFNEFLHLIRAAEPGFIDRLLLVGDSDQLPAIGAGRVLADIIASGKFPIAQLTQVMRQGKDSLIAIAAGQIRQGLPIPKGDKEADFHVTYADPIKQRSLLERAFRDRIPLLEKKNGQKYDPMRDVQVLVPQHGGPLGDVVLNPMLRNILNPPAPNKKEYRRQGEVIFRQGDKIMISKNNRESQVANGDIGYIKDIHAGQLVIELPDLTVELSQADPTVQLGYAITVHKAQGSEAPMVISLFNDDVPKMLRVRNLLYTAVTRAKEQFWLLGSEKVIEECISNNQPTYRQTLLQQYIEHFNGVAEQEETIGID